MTKSQQQNVPALRFSEFSDNWTRAPIMSYLSKVIDYRGKAPPKTEQGVPLITARNVRFGYLDFKVDEYIDSNVFESWMNRGRPKANDVLFTTEAPLGNVALFPSDGVYALGQRIITLQTKTSKCDSKFLFQHLITPNTQKRIQRRGTGSTAKGIKSKLFIKIPLAAPTISEQTKIAAFLSAVDEKIEQLTRKRALLEQYKKGMMQKLFSQELRFKDNNGNLFPDWEEKKLDEIFDISAGGDVHKLNFSKKITDQFNIPVYGNALKNHGLYGYTDTAKVINDAVTVTGRGDVGYAEARLIPFVPVVRLLVLIPKSEASVIFFKHAINQMKIFVESTGVPQLTAPQISQYKLSFPIPKEQKKIADFLSSIDDKIDRINTELTQAQTFKKGLLQQMFV